MSLSYNPKLLMVAKQVCRDLRKRSTNAEKLFWEHVRNRKLKGKKFNRQFPIFYDFNGKETFFVADFYCHEANLVVELDGGIHKFKIESDKERTEILEMKKLRVIRFKNEEVEKDVNKVMGKLKNVLNAGN